jgi:hypothetical protein
MIAVMVTNISDRFCNVTNITFFCPLRPKQFANYQQDFIIKALNCLMQTFGRCFDPVHLKSELVAVYSNVKFPKSVDEFDEYLYGSKNWNMCSLKPTSLPDILSQYQL